MNSACTAHSFWEIRVQPLLLTLRLATIITRQGLVPQLYHVHHKVGMLQRRLSLTGVQQYGAILHAASAVHKNIAKVCHPRSSISGAATSLHVLVTDIGSGAVTARRQISDLLVAAATTRLSILECVARQHYYCMLAFAALANMVHQCSYWLSCYRVSVIVLACHTS
eukprot:3318-Heterococcus_DN1.PRE.1